MAVAPGEHGLGVGQCVGMGLECGVYVVGMPGCGPRNVTWWGAGGLRLLGSSLRGMAAGTWHCLEGNTPALTEGRSRAPRLRLAA